MTTTDPVVDRVRDLRMEVAAGRPAGGLVDLPAAATAAVDTAVAVGAPLLPVLDSVAAGIRAERDIAHAVGAAAAPARLVAIALTFLPLVAVPVLSRLTGADLLAFYATPPGVAIAAAGGALWLTGVAVTATIVRRAGRAPTVTMTGRFVRPLVVGVAVAAVMGPVAGVLAGIAARWWRSGSQDRTDPDLATACDVVAAGLSAGIAPTTALRYAADRMPGLRADLRRLALHLEIDRAPDVPRLQPLADVLRTATRLGGPAVPAVRELAEQVRADRLAAALADAQRLPTRLTFPAALCLLPATLLLVGAPIVAEGLAAVIGT